MITYYSTKKENVNGYHKLHTRDCLELPMFDQRAKIGICENYPEAISAALNLYPGKSFIHCEICCNTETLDSGLLFN